MLCTADEIRSYVTTDLTDAQIVARMAAIEAAVRAYTNNHFLEINAKANAYQVAAATMIDNDVFQVGDTVEINHSVRSDGLCKVIAADGEGVLLDPVPYGEKGGFTVTLVKYPADVVMAAINMLKWSLEYGDKQGIKSETISRWSVTYFDMDNASEGGYPRAIMTALKPYRQAQI